ncbi:hypothetical protein [Nonomuraea sp. NPDC049758]|uniref:hypothetical protein n=1 Tax=Nonomuraea sp. NPDC049758 TaxID=3154360 RepID=UPI003444707F
MRSDGAGGPVDAAVHDADDPVPGSAEHGRRPAPSSTQLLWIFDIHGFVMAGFLVAMGVLGDRAGKRLLG